MENSEIQLIDPRKETVLLETMRDYLKEIGWVSMVGSVDRIEQLDDTNYEVVFRFTGWQIKVSE